MKKEMILLFFLFQFCTFDGVIERKKRELDYSERYLSSEDSYSGNTLLFFDGKHIWFDCEYNETVDRDIVFYRSGPKPVKVETKMELKLSNIKFGLYTCGVESDMIAGYVKHLLCNDQSDMCQNLDCPNTDSRSFCVVDETNLSPTECRHLTIDDCVPKDKPNVPFGFSSFGYACQPNSEDKYVTFCVGMSTGSKELIPFIAMDKENCKDGNNLVVKTSNGTQLYLGHIGRLGSSLVVTCKGGEYCNVVRVFEARMMKKKQKLGYSNVSKSFILPQQKYSAITKIVIETKVRALHTYVYNVRLNSSVQLKNIGKSVTCSFRYPPERQQEKMFKLHLILKRNDTVIKESNSRSVSADCSNDTSYTCEAEMKVKQCNPFYTDVKKSMATLDVTECKNETPTTVSSFLETPTTVSSYGERGKTVTCYEYIGYILCFLIVVELTFY